jgi:hypothetical protein
MEMSELGLLPGAGLSFSDAALDNTIPNQNFTTEGIICSILSMLEANDGIRQVGLDASYIICG